MDICDQKERPSEVRPQRGYAIGLPNSREGVGVALRSAFSAPNRALPEDMRLLLERIDR